MATTSSKAWPELPYLAWRENYATLQLWTQIVGKIRLALTPWLNVTAGTSRFTSARAA